MQKNFRIPGEQMRDLTSLPGGCMITDRITVDGERTCYMARQFPMGEVDTGWAFFAGDEDDAYLADPGNLGLYALNTIANYAPDVIPLLEIPAPCAFERDPDTGEWKAVTPVFEA
jgi:hypothetical protein